MVPSRTVTIRHCWQKRGKVSGIHMIRNKLLSSSFSELRNGVTNPARRTLELASGRGAFVQIWGFEDLVFGRQTVFKDG